MSEGWAWAGLDDGSKMVFSFLFYGFLKCFILRLGLDIRSYYQLKIKENVFDCQS